MLVITEWTDSNVLDYGQIQFVGSSATSCRLEKLASDTKYFFDIRIISTDQKETSSPLKLKNSKLNPSMPVQSLKKMCGKVEIRDRIKVHFLPLTKSVSSGQI